MIKKCLNIMNVHESVLFNLSGDFKGSSAFEVVSMVIETFSAIGFAFGTSRNGL